MISESSHSIPLTFSLPHVVWFYNVFPTPIGYASDWYSNDDQKFLPHRHFSLSCQHSARYHCGAQPAGGDVCTLTKGSDNGPRIENGPFETKMINFTFDYYLMVVIAVFGTLQVAASIGRLDGLLLFKSRRAARGFGIILVLIGLALFFGTGERNINDYEGGLDGNFQGLFFLLGTITALALTIALTSFVNRGMYGDPGIGDGIESLKRTNFARGLATNLGHLRKHWRTWTKPYFFG